MDVNYGITQTLEFQKRVFTSIFKTDMKLEGD